MAQTGFTPIQIYSSSTASAAPVAGSLTNSTLGSELAINITDGKLFYKDNANAIQVIAWKTTPTSAGGTGLTSYTAGDLLYYATGTALSKLAIGASGQYLSSTGSAPQWSAPAALTKTDDTNVTLTLGGSASTALLNAASLTLGWTGTLAATRGGTGLGSYAVGDLLYADTTTSLAKLADVATGNALISGGVGVAPSWGKIGLTTHVSGILPIANGGTGQTAFGGNRVIFTNVSGQLVESSNLTYDGTTFQVSGKASLLNPDLATGGFNITATYSYNNGTANTIGGSGTFNQSHHIIHINTGTGLTSIPVYTNGGAGVAWNYIYLDPDAATWAVSGASPTITFTVAGSGGNTFDIVLNSGTGSATIQRTAGTNAYTVYIQRIAGF
jgi:hypothetical protein